MDAWKLYYDGECNLCHASQLRAVRWAKQAGQPMDVELLQSPEAQAKGYGKHIVLEADGRVYFGGDAWLRALRLAPAPLRWISLGSKTALTRAIVAVVYACVAKVRRRLMGKRSCPLPGNTPEH